jgi:hypothetical protein
MALTRNQEFMERVQAMMARTCNGVLTEPGTTPYHSMRAAYAQRVVSSPIMAASQGAAQIVMGVNVVAATVYDEATKTSTCTIADIDLESQILTLWNSLGGIDTPN